MRALGSVRAIRTNLVGAFCRPLLGEQAFATKTGGMRLGTSLGSLVAACVLSSSAAASLVRADEPKSAYDFTIESSSGEPVALSQFRDKPVWIVVNVASQCGFTSNHYTELEQLREKYGDQGLEIIAIPSNEFGGQEPGSNAEIQAFADSRGATFPVMAKSTVNGAQADPFMRFLKQGAPGYVSNELAWNFTKFIVFKGQPHSRWEPVRSPSALEATIRELLAEAGTLQDA